MDTFLRDLRYGFRYLLRRPGYTLAAVVALALGIGASTAIFSVLYAALWRTLPYRDASQLVIVWEHDRVDQEEQNVANPANFADWREQNQVFQDMAATADSLANLTGGAQPEEIPIQYVTPNFFSVVGSYAMLGRTFTDKDGPSEDRVVILSNGLWQRRFGADRSIIGKKILVNGRQAVVIGVMPANFQWFI
jgi:putative ABC transport system permease protein